MNKETFLNLKYQKNKFLKLIKGFNDEKKILKALKMAEKSHRKQIRDNYLPYIIHPIRTAVLLIEIVKIKDEDLICAALLHDVLEDTDLTAFEIKKELGENVLKLVQALTRERLENETEEQKIKNKEEKIKKIAGSNKEVRLIKLCDKLDNKYSQEFIPEGHPSKRKMERWDKEFKQYLPIAEKTNSRLFSIFKRIVEN